MSGRDEEESETIRPEFNPAIMVDFQGAKITSEEMVDGVVEGEVRSETVKSSLFIDVTTVLPVSGSAGLPTETFLGSEGRPLCPSRVPRGSKWQDRFTIPG